MNWSATPGGPGGAGVPQFEAAVAPGGISAVFDYVYSQPGTGLANLSSPVFIQQSEPASVLVGVTPLELPKFQFSGNGIGQYFHSAGSVILNEELRLGSSSPGTVQGFYTLSGSATLSVARTLLVDHGLFTQTGGFSTFEHTEVGASSGFKPGGVAMSGGTMTTTTSFNQIIGASTFSGGHTNITTYLSALEGSINISGGIVSAGSVSLGNLPGTQLIQTGGTLTSTGSLSVGAGAVYRYNAGALSCSQIDINSHGQPWEGLFAFGTGTAPVARTRAITMSSGRMDLNQGAVVVDHDGTSPLASIRSLVVTGYAAGAWNGLDGIGSSFAAANPGYAIGYAEASAIFTTFPATFRGQQVDNTTVLVGTVRAGDADLSGTVNLDDFNRLASNFNTASGSTWTRGDFNYDGATNLNDFNLLAGNFNLSAGPDGVVDPEDWAALAAVVPEPVAIAALATLVSLFRMRTPRSVPCYNIRA